MPQRNYSQKRSKVTKVSKRIILPITLKAYNEVVQEAQTFRAWLDIMIATYPELFPKTISQGYTLHDILPPSVKMPAVRLRRIRLKAADQDGRRAVFTIASSEVLPYMTGYTDEVEKPLFLRRFAVPFWGLTYVFGRNDSYWYRLSTHLGRYPIVGTTLQAADKLPDHLLADEKHIRFNGHKAYIATTVAADCVLGASVALNVDQGALSEAYGHFKPEAHQVKPDYEPDTVNIDGWSATQKAWQVLFRTITVIECFLHTFLKIRNRCKKRWQPLWPEIQQQVWDLYHAPNRQSFREQTADFLTWAQDSGLIVPELTAVNLLSRLLTNSMGGSIIITGFTICSFPPLPPVLTPTTENVRTRKSLLDHLVQMHDQYIMEICRKARNAYEKKHRQLRQRQKRAVDTILYATHILLDWSEDEPLLHTEFWQRISRTDLQTSSADLQRFQQLTERGYGDLLLARYPTLRKYFADFIQLPFAENPVASP